MRGQPLFSKIEVKGDHVYDGFDVPSETTKDYLIRKVQDKFRRLHVIQRNIIKSGGTVSEKADAYLADELYPGKAEEVLREFETKHARPFIKALSRAKSDMEDLDMYVYAKHAPERNAHIAEINEKFRDSDIPGSGMSNEEARDVLAKFKEDGKADELESLAQRLYAINNDRLALLESSGLENKETLGAWKKYKYYVPLKGLAGKESHMRLGRGFDIRGKESKRAMGRRSLAESPVIHTIAQMEESLIRSEKNRVGVAFKNLVEENPNQSLWRITEAAEHKKPRYNEKTREVTYGVDPMYKLADNVLSVKEDGQEYYIEIMDEPLARAGLQVLQNMLVARIVGDDQHEALRRHKLFARLFNGQHPPVITKRVDDHGRILARLNDFIKVADAALSDGPGNRSVNPDCFSALDEVTAHQIGGGQVVMTGNGIERQA